MRKIAVTIFLFVYLFSIAGATVSMHYCMGRLVNWNFQPAHSKTCDRCGMLKSKPGDGGCCNDQSVVIRANADLYTPAIGVQGMEPFAGMVPASPVAMVPGELVIVALHPCGPVWAASRYGPAIYLRNRVLLI